MDNLNKEFNSFQKSTLTQIVELNNNLIKVNQEKNTIFKELMLEIIEVIDTYEKAEDIIIERGLDKSENGLKIIERYRTVHKKLINLLIKKGVTEIEFPDNRLIIGFCKIVETEPDNTKPDDTIVSVLRKGYHRGKELIREAELIIVKN
jgi:molecular chaperone GrpE (heat shock protein)